MNQTSDPTVSCSAWFGILSDVFQVDLAERMDSVDIRWEALNLALEGMEDRQILALQARYGENFTFKDIGQKIGRKDGTGPLSREITRQVLCRSIRMLRHPARMRVLKSAIVASWNLL